ncbi:NAD(P)H:quinone oxidoreductase, type IV (plasmid) [Alloyangia pacifica]|uniref:NAD(P)H:quinone oxidoreductase, type IV n=1 Tax=Alloyangia pacifica TaxID=311180 RepID=A0A2U8HK18_9RHOB|nr:NAD(P)H:quinone oxidoreductase type IV [Alloyangia pacifica]AWI86267.1 NAD(P)H:quinone oxidoreductase, type IV [Alloyangia pacifica]NDV51141.1 NAD(P)H:quinone oxidoreductase type IV [Salipiger sp. PrR003]NDW32910.1 NAD(P)H:quinone oxidoreductase type IV [Salipiger sp. PrR007]
MAHPKIAVIFYSTYGTNHQIALAAAEAAKDAGAEVRLLRVAETAPEAVVNGQDAWKAQAEKMADIPVVTPDDMVWADGYFFSAPTRYGQSASQLRAFIDTLGGVWSEGKLAGKTITATTSAQNVHGGQEATTLGLYTTAMHWGAIIVAPGYTSDVIYASGGNPYGFSTEAGAFDETGKASVSHQAKRLVDITAKLIA